jgi:hypothetical protein
MENSLSGDDTEISCGFDKQNNWNFSSKCFSRLRLFDWTIFAVFLGFSEGDDVEGGDVVLHLSREIRPKRIDQVRIVDGEEQFRENLKFN